MGRSWAMVIAKLYKSSNVMTTLAKFSIECPLWLGFGRLAGASGTTVEYMVSVGAGSAAFGFRARTTIAPRVFDERRQVAETPG
jgi:hypothetical protein